MRPPPGTLDSHQFGWSGSSVYTDETSGKESTSKNTRRHRAAESNSMQRIAYRGSGDISDCRTRDLAGLALGVILVALLGCEPRDPFYLRHVDRDLSHYNAVANEIEYPDVEADRLADVSGANRPFSLTNTDPKEIWNLTLEQAVQVALTNNKVMRSIGGQVQGPPEFILRNPALVPTVYDPALAESNPNTGVEAALSAFDTRFSSSLMWQRVDSPNNWNRFDGLALLLPFEDREDIGAFQAKLSKMTATGGEFSLTHEVDYDKTNAFNNILTGYPADWNVKLTAEMRQPLLQGNGIEFNRIAGPGAKPGQYNGVVLARINTDIALADFEIGVRNLINDVETTYWELYFAYRNFDTVIAGREMRLSTWRKVSSLARAGARAVRPSARHRRASSTSCSAAAPNDRSTSCTPRKPNSAICSEWPPPTAGSSVPRTSPPPPRWSSIGTTCSTRAWCAASNSASRNGSSSAASWS